MAFFCHATVVHDSVQTLAISPSVRIFDAMFSGVESDAAV